MKTVTPVAEFRIQREGTSARRATAANVGRELRRLRPESRGCSFAVLWGPAGDYFQVGGGGGGMMLEKRVGREPFRHFRAFQSPPVVPFEDGTTLRVGGGRIALRRDEWFTRDQLTQIWTAFVVGAREPSWVHWRDVTSLFDTHAEKP